MKDFFAPHLSCKTVAVVGRASSVFYMRGRANLVKSNSVQRSPRKRESDTEIRRGIIYIKLVMNVATTLLIKHRATLLTKKGCSASPVPVSFFFFFIYFIIVLSFWLIYGRI